MKINVLGYTVAITITKSGLLSRVEKLAQTYADYGAGRTPTKLARIRAHRNLTGCLLKESKDWVESHFAD